MLGPDSKYPAGHPKTNLWRFSVKNSKILTVEHFILEKPIWLNFVNLSTIFCPRLYVLPRLTCLLPHAPSHASRNLYLTCSIVNQYDKQDLLKECYYSGFFHKCISLQDPLIYVNTLTSLHLFINSH